MSKLKILKYIIPTIVLIVAVALASRGGCSLSMLGGNDIHSGIDHEQNEGYIAFIVNEEEYKSPDTTPQPDPDPEKCACKGTGIITHGDGHTTHCPYHYDDDDDDDGERDWRCKCDTKRTYCNCKHVHGKCSCNKK